MGVSHSVRGSLPDIRDALTGIRGLSTIWTGMRRDRRPASRRQAEDWRIGVTACLAYVTGIGCEFESEVQRGIRKAVPSI
ncbi:MAG: hypothetical protein VST68_10160 [Nitrospirota bacterium]|nr:hypothetical protein [Nitrospirota bacterium]